MAAPAFVVDARDEDLMLAYAAGDATAFDALYARHKGGLYRYLMRQCGHAGIVDELFQDVWLSAIRARTTYVPSAKFTTWLYRIATHILAFEGDSQVRFFEGNVSDYEAFRHKELGTAADQPRRIRYKRLVA